MTINNYRQSALRILFLLVKASDLLTDPIPPEYVRIFDGETKLQALDFWMRYPDYLADELLNLYEKTSDVYYLNEARSIFSNQEPDLRCIPMLRRYFGAYEPLDTALSILKSRGLVLPRTRPMTENTNHQNFLISRTACDLIRRIPSEVHDLKWYDKRVDLVLKVAGNRGGGALKDCQHERREYHNTRIDDLIPTIAERVWQRLNEMETKNV